MNRNVDGTAVLPPEVLSDVASIPPAEPEPPAKDECSSIRPCSMTATDGALLAAAHDLRGHLRTVASYLELLAEQALDERGERHLHFAASGTAQLSAIVSGLLDLANIAPLATRVGSTSALFAFERAKNKLDRLIRETKAQIGFESLPEVHANPELLGRVFEELLSNALRCHGDAPRLVYVSARRRARFWTISVTDNGDGVDQCLKESVFEACRRGANMSTPGAGIGLTIAKRIVEAFGGTISIEQRVPAGTRVSFTLRAAT